MAIIKLNDREQSTILAALRCWQRMHGASRQPPEWHIATNEGTVEPLDERAIDALCESLNTGGMTFPGCIEAFAAPDDDPHVAAARDLCAADDDLSIDDKTVVSAPSEPSDIGRWVVAWVWVTP
jgi:hypothetical protein